MERARDDALGGAGGAVSGLAFMGWNVNFTTGKIGTFGTELVREFFKAFAMNAGITLHINNHYGANNHHIAESIFEAVARVLRTALETDPRQKDAIPSTKGSLKG